MFIRWVKKIALFVLRVCFNFRVENPLPEEMGRAIICSNHASNWDPVALYAISPDNAVIVAKKELQDVFFIGWLIQKVNIIFVDRDHNDIAAMRQMLKALDENRPLILFPEGTRVKEPSPDQIKDGIGYIVQKGKADVHCARIDTDYHFRSPFVVRFRPTLSAASLSQFDRKSGRHRIAELVYQMIYTPEALLSGSTREFVEEESEG